jgi:phosphopentomutase
MGAARHHSAVGPFRFSRGAMARAFIFVLDSFGIGHAPDAGRFGDEGADTFGHIEAECAARRADRAGLREGPLHLPHMTALGLGAAAALAAGRLKAAGTAPAGFYGAAAERSSGKDTPSGHWEIAGVPVPFDWGYFPETVPAFPHELIEKLIAEGDIPGILGDCHASGTEIIARLGEEHIRTGKPICYTSADSVFQIAAHEEPRAGFWTTTISAASSPGPSSARRRKASSERPTAATMPCRLPNPRFSTAWKRPAGA